MIDFMEKNLSWILLMNKINPIYILLFFVVVLIISFTQLKEKREKLVTEQTNFLEFSKKALEYKSLVKKSTKENIVAFLEKVRNNPRYKKANIKVSNKEDSYIVSLRGNNLSTHQKLLNDILNNNFNIKQLNITKTNLEIELSYE